MFVCFTFVTQSNKLDLYEATCFIIEVSKQKKMITPTDVGFSTLKHLKNSPPTINSRCHNTQHSSTQYNNINHYTNQDYDFQANDTWDNI
jgi:hypothetical protein